ncbi:cellular tumor antigen p53 isoform X1 [Dendroctonus ponderosae]|uniref:p53 DNA-binding domain-containing protein n=2 Tax=Dendroctonus ponderosae TaxID=77166 RepID=A0AAR5P0Q1_DENPD|nr:cellular tumor antigen p53 isoform X1 [Dendroctonus ponderosae]XP_019754096.1 cellular tumor antigen p53 isoform X1 [Dendroctonus ponderosae]KAH1022805.1 hypothetical protein HUJ04_012142 [Dendroctonus ponderosae]KAH1029259.1 hypothetical protein HUJ05_002528 [Dendroctonus ponderosae]
MSQFSSQLSSSMLPEELLDPEVQAEINRGLGSQEMQLLCNLLPCCSEEPQDWSSPFDVPDPEPVVETKAAVDSIEPLIRPSRASEIMCTDDHQGEMLFDVSVCDNEGVKNTWIFSPRLNKVFVEVNRQIPLDFKVENPTGQRLFVRATLQYSSQEFAADPVIRCHQHRVEDKSNRNIETHVRRHVLRCGNQNAIYIGNEAGERPSFIFPLAVPQAGSHSVRELIQFVCKSSCYPPGMNRKQVDIIFTLENSQSEVLGRKSIKAKVCACPKRDKDKEEKPSLDKVRLKRRRAEEPADGQSETRNEPLTEFDLKVRCYSKPVIQKIVQNIIDVYRSQMHELRDNPFEYGRVEKVHTDMLKVQKDLFK